MVPQTCRTTRPWAVPQSMQLQSYNLAALRGGLHSPSNLLTKHKGFKCISTQPSSTIARLRSTRHPHHLGHPQTHHLGHPAECAHSPHFDPSLRPPPNASLQAHMMILHTVSPESDWSVCWRGWEGSFYLHHDLTQPFRRWLGGGEGSFNFIMT